jgi:hypothetical protein
MLQLSLKKVPCLSQSRRIGQGATFEETADMEVQPLGTPAEVAVKGLAFKGANEDNEIETLDEFLAKVDGHEPAALSLSGWVFQAVDFSALPAAQFLQYAIPVHQLQFMSTIN